MAVILGLFGLIYSVINCESAVRVGVMTTELDALERRNEALERDNRRLALVVEALRTDPRLVEKIAREELGMIEQGEIIYLFTEEPTH